MPRGPGERQVWRSLSGHEGESRIQIKADLELPLAVPGGQGVHREVESEGHEEKVCQEDVNSVMLCER